MTEAEWLTSDNLVELIEAVEGRASDRRFSLFVIAAGYASESMPDQRLEKLVSYVDGFATLDQMEKSWEGGSYWMEHPFRWARDYASAAYNGEEGYPSYAELVPFFRDIFGNPFRPVAFSPLWRTDTAVSLASQMYESPEFSAMPILADALQDAGCEHNDILNHCRGPGPHVRGCWVIDLVLGKT